MPKKDNLKIFLKSFENKKIIIWGLGLNFGGLEAVKFFAKKIKSAEITVLDLKSKAELTKSLKEIKCYKNVKVVLGRQEEKDFLGADLVIKNPAIPWELALVKKLQSKNIRIETDITLFFKFFKGKIIGITGSKGKTTTTTLIGQLLKKGGKDVFLGGNIRVSLFAYLKESILENRRKIAVLELSSFQLEDLFYAKRGPEIAVVTNVLRDHLNRYGTMKKYLEAKKLIALFQQKSDFLVLNEQDKNQKIIQKNILSSKFYFSSKKLVGSRGVSLESEPLSFLIKGTGKKELFKVNNPFFSQPHNAQSLGLALIVCRLILGVSEKLLEKEVNSFEGVPYRMEKIREISGVAFYNDTTATIPDATIGNLALFSSKVILISGGSDKNLKFERFAQVVSRKAKKVILLPGNITAVIRQKIKKLNPKISCIDVKNMREGVHKAFENAKKGDVIILSPGCTSFGLFKNEFDRGDQFNKEVADL